MAKIDIKKISKVKILLVTLIIAAVAFGVYNILWFQHISIINTFLDNSYLEEIKNTPSAAPENFTLNGIEYRDYSFSRYTYERLDGWEYHSYKDFDYNERGYHYTIYIPPYLRFDGGIQMLNSTDEHNLMLLIHPHISQKNWEYLLFLSDVVVEGSHTEVSGVGVLDVDKNGLVLDAQPHYDDNQTELQTALDAYERYNEPIMEMFATLSEVFGDTLK